MLESDLIDRYFKPAATSPAVILGIGDDAAIIDVPADAQLALTVDTLVQGVHFFPDTDPCSIGYKAVAVNLSDLAAMGARPHWLTLSLTLPEIDHDWLRHFSSGFHELGREFSLDLIGGDLSRGPLSITVQACGLVPRGRVPTRRNAAPGDLIYITGQVGAAGLALKLKKKELPDNGQYTLEHTCLNRPYPRIEAGLLLREHATSMIDISDGLIADLGHIMRQSRVGAEINLDKLPLTPNLRKLGEETAWNIALSSGDDYELCFSLVGKDNANLLQEIRNHCPVTQIGRITDSNTLTLLKPDGKEMIANESGYQHFA